MFECTIFWEGELFAHTAQSRADALEWAMQYPVNQPGCKARIWFKGYQA